MIRALPAAASLLLAVAAGAPPEAATPAPPPAGAETPLAALPYTPGLDLSAMDRSADPCGDFYAYACGGWRKANPIPPDQASWSVYGKLQRDVQRYLWGLLDRAARPAAGRGPAERKIGDAFAACMDEARVERAGAAPLRSDLRAVDGLASKRGLAPLLGRLHASGAGGLFDFGSQQSFEDSGQVVAVAAAGGLGLPDRDQYLLEDARSVEIRRRYREHVERMLALSGLRPGEARRGAETVLRIETALARGSLTRVERRDPRKIWHRTPLAALRALTPAFRWDDYLRAVGAPRAAWLDVTEPEFFRTVEAQLAREPLSAWKVYLRWHLVRARAPALSHAFVNESFAFYGRFLRGVERLAPRWRRCVNGVDRDLGEALGRVFVARVFPPAVKTDAVELVRRVKAAMAERLQEVDWMGPATRQAALAKLAAVKDKVGYPARWRDYSALRIDRRDHAGNVVRAAAFEMRRQLRKIGRPVDRDEWQMTPQTVNAYYDASMNDMNFPAGVLLPPLWDPRMDLAPGYGDTGGTVGHELTHGFDDEGRRFDARGNLKDWWTPQDGADFERRAQCIVDQFGAYPVVDEIKVNSRLTLGEDIADLGGTILAWMAWKEATRGAKLEPVDGLTPAQRFFVGYAQWACANERPEELRQRALTDEHSPPRWRVDGPLSNMPEFARAFDCRAGQPMVREQACRVW